MSDLNNCSQEHPAAAATSTKKQRLLPVPLKAKTAPVRQDIRQHYLKLLYEQYGKAHLKNHPDDSIDTYPLKNRLVRKAVKKEYEFALNGGSKAAYQHGIKMFMATLRKYGTEDGRPYEPEPVLSPAEGYLQKVYEQLHALCILPARLKDHHYVTEIPRLPTPDYKLPTFIDCDRCGVKFKIDDISKNVSCKFHRGKVETKTYDDLNTGKKIYGTDYTGRFYTCCKEVVGTSEGCEVANHHVYKFKKPIDLHLAKNFQTIQSLRKSLNIDNNSKAQLVRSSKIKAAGIDCEMCYTNKGFEMMKLSLVDFETEKKLIDAIVHPDGDLIIDLNSKISGVDEIPPDALTFDEALIKLAQLTDEDTIMVGHGLENDFNVLRLIYPKVVDTAIILSTSEINIRRKSSLKALAYKYLSKNIQAKQHDSLEDAVMPCKVIKAHINHVVGLMRFLKEKNKC